MDNVPGILTAFGGLPPNIIILLIGAIMIWWGTNRKWNKAMKVEERIKLQSRGWIIVLIAILWMAAIAIIPYFIGGLQ